MPTCVIADDFFAIREGLRALFEGEGWLTVVAEAHDGQAAIEAIAAHRPDVALVDMRMPNGTGLDVLDELRQRRIETPVIIFSAIGDAFLVERALRSGAAGYMVKSTSHELLDRAIRSVLEGRRFVDPDVAVELLNPSAQQLSPREREVLTLAAEGHSNKQIAAELGLGVETVRSHMATVMSKLMASNRTEAVAKAFRMTLVS